MRIPLKEKPRKMQSHIEGLRMWIPALLEMPIVILVTIAFWNGNFASDQCGKIALFQQSGKCEKCSHLGNKPVTIRCSMFYFHEYGREDLSKLAMLNILFLYYSTKSYQKHQHESTFNIFLRCFLWFALSVF